MLLALHGDPIVELTPFFQKIKNLHPKRASLLALQEGIHMPDYDHAFPSSGEDNIDPLRGGQEPDIPARIAPREGYHHNVAFFALVIV